MSAGAHLDGHLRLMAIDDRERESERDALAKLTPERRIIFDVSGGRVLDLDKKQCASLRSVSSGLSRREAAAACHWHAAVS